MPKDAALRVLHAKRMRGIVDHLEVVVVGDLLDCLYIAGMPVQCTGMIAVVCGVIRPRSLTVKVERLGLCPRIPA